MSKLFTVTLTDFSDLPPAERSTAETRYTREIERVLGGHESVAQVYRAWLDANEAEASELSTDVAVQAVRWPRAADKAAQAGFRSLGEPGGAYFEVRLERSDEVVS